MYNKKPLKTPGTRSMRFTLLDKNHEPLKMVEMVFSVKDPDSQVETVQQLLALAKRYARTLCMPVAVRLDDERDCYLGRNGKFSSIKHWFRPPGRPAASQRIGRQLKGKQAGAAVTVYLTRELLDAAELLGAGSVQAGIRDALRKA